MADYQDISGLPATDELAQLELQRKLKMADLLRQSQTPQGQMVGNRFVAPSWTQYAADLANKYIGSKQEENAMKQYGEYNKSKQDKLSQAFDAYIKGKEPIAETQSTDNYVSKPYDIGANIPTSMFGTTEQLAQTSPSFNTQNMPEQMVNQPITSTTYRQPTRTEQLANITNFLKKSDNTDMLNKVVLGEAENLFKTPESVLGKVDLDKFDAQSINDFIKSGSKDYSLLKPIVKDVVPTTRNMKQGTNEITQQWDPQSRQWVEIARGPAFKEEDRNKPPVGYAWGKPDASGNPTLIPLTGGPADKSQILKPVPAQVATGFVENQNAINKIDNAISVIQSTPDSSFGLKNIAGDTVMQRLDPKGVNARSVLSGIAGQKYHDISGAAVSVGEANRLKPYIPSAQDTKENILQKLYNMKAEYGNTNELMQNQFNEQQGYKPLQQQNIPINSSMQSNQGGWKIEKVQ